MSKPGALPAQGEPPPTQQYLLDSGRGVHQSQIAMPAPVAADSTGPQLQPSGLQQHQGPVHRQPVVGHFYQLSQQISRTNMNQMNTTALTAHNSTPQFQRHLGLIYPQTHSFPGHIPHQTSLVLQGGVHPSYHRLPQYGAAPQYNISSTQQTMFLTPASHSYAYSQQSQQQVYFPVSPSSMASIPSTLPSMTPSGAGTAEKREKKILQVVDPKTGQDIMQDIISYSSSKENNAPVNEVAAQFALQVAALATSKENSSVKEEIQDPGKPLMSTADLSNGLKTFDVDSKSKPPTSSVNDSDGANGFSGNGVTTVVLNPASKTVPCELNGKHQVNREQSNEDGQSADEGEEKFLSSSEIIPVSLVEKVNGPEKSSGVVSVSMKEMAVMPKDESAYVVEPSEVETSGITVKQVTVQEIEQIPDFKPQEDGIKNDHIEILAVEKENIGISELGKDVKENEDCRRMKELKRKSESEEGEDMDAYLSKKENTIPNLPPTPGQVSPNLRSQESVDPIGMLQEDQYKVEGKTQTNRKLSHEEQVVEKNQINLMDKGENQIIKSNLDNKKAQNEDQNTDNEFSSKTFSQEELVPDKTQINSKTLSHENQLTVDTKVKDCELKEEQEATEELATVNGQTEGQITLKYNYQADQWSPLNLEGKKQYDRSFLLQLQSEVASLKKPQGLPKLEIIKDTATLFKQGDVGKPQSQSSNHSDSFMPVYAGGGQQRNDHGGMTGRRHSQHSRDKGKKIFTSSYSKDVKLHSSENAWKPARQAEKPSSQEEQKTQELYKRVQGILNKLTPQKFQTLVSQVKELPIDNEERLVGVMNLVFKKAIEEPSFSVPYANMCKTLAMMQVPAAEGSNQCVKFSKLLLTKCQREFEKDINDEINKDERLRQIQEAETEEKKIQLQEELDEEETKAKRRSLGNIRFVGELFKLGMLTTLIMHTCIKKLLGQGDEDSLECLCRLLTTIGKEIARDKNKSTQTAMETYFEAMKQIVKKRKTSSRIRFMLQDVIDLRQNNWVSRREDDNPKTIDQIHLEAQKEAQQQQLLLQQVHVAPQKRSDERERRKSRNNPPVSEEGWNMVTSRSKIDTSKLKQFAKGGQAEVENIQLGPGRSFYSWGKGSSGGSKGQGQDSESRTPNRFSALSATEQSFNSRPASQRSAASSWESSQNRGNAAIRKTSSQTQQKDLENVKASVKSVLLDVESKPVPQGRIKKSEDVKMTLKGKDMSEEEMEVKTIPLIDEFLHNCDFKEATHCVIELVSPSTSCFFISAAINQVLERSSQARHLVGQLLHDLVRSKILPAEMYIKGLKSILENADDFAIDIPRIWEYLGDLVGPMIQDGSLPLSFLREAAEPCMASGTAGKLLSAVLHAAAGKLGSVKVGELWKKSGLQWTEFLSSGQNVDKFVEENKLEFTVSETKPLPDAHLSMEQIKEKLDFLLQKKKSTNEDILDWIEIHVGEKRSKTSQFIRVLITAVVENAIEGEGSTCKFNNPAVSERLSVLQKYLNNNEDFELQALYELQALVNRLEHPKGLLLDMFNVFYDLDLLSDEAYNRWEQSTDPTEQEGKGVALKSVVSFFTWLKEAEEESADSN